jgi:DNA replication protein DnaC
MHSDITTNLKSLRLHGMAVAWEELIENGVTTRVDSSQWLLQHLLEAEDTNRAMRSISHQMKSARFPLHRDLAGFDFAASPVDKALINKLSDLSFTETAQNVVLIGGPTGLSDCGEVLRMRRSPGPTCHSRPCCSR